MSRSTPPKAVERDPMKLNALTRIPARAGAIALLALTVSCAETQDQDSLLNYSRTAEKQFEEAMDEFHDEDCIAAEKQLQDVRRQFPYSRFAVLAEIRIADCQFVQGNYAEAAVSYQQFQRTHPTHEEAAWAAFRRGLSYYEMIPGDWLITPPPHERDQSSTREARAALDQYVERYPRSDWIEKAQRLKAEVEDALVRHEMYVAEFYLGRDDRRAASVRLEEVRKMYPTSRLVPDAMFLQAVTFLEMDREEEARRVLGDIIEHYPDHHQTSRAVDFLKHLDQRTGGEQARR